MKTVLLPLILSLLALAPSNAQTVSSSSSPVVNVTNELTELAAGYAKAFASIERQPVNALVRLGDKPTLLVDITKVTAFAGAVRIEVRTGLVYVISPKDVLVISDDSRLKP